MGTLGILWTSTGGQNGRKMDPKNVSMGEKGKKMNIFHRQGLLFGWLPRKYMKIGVSVHVGTSKRLLASGGGKICITDAKFG